MRFRQADEHVPGRQVAAEDIDAAARRTFAYSIFYLALLFAALMVDHYLPLLSR